MHRPLFLENEFLIADFDPELTFRVPAQINRGAIFTIKTMPETATCLIGDGLERAPVAEHVPDIFGAPTLNINGTPRFRTSGGSFSPPFKESITP